MSDEKFLLEYERLLDKGYCDCNEMNCIDNDSPRRILRIAKNLQQENNGLKKQLENCYCNRTDCSGRIKDNKQYDSLMQKIESQQKKFIEYLEDYIEVLKSQQENVNGLDILEEETLFILEETLEKYKEIIGDKDEGNKKL